MSAKWQDLPKRNFGLIDLLATWGQWNKLSTQQHIIKKNYIVDVAKVFSNSCYLLVDREQH